MTDRATPAILGIDLGTTEVKAGLVDLDGRLLAIARAGYGLAVGHGPGWAEQDPGAWWSAVVGAVRGLRPEVAIDVVAIGVDGHGPTLAAVDDRGEATRPAITFLDTRAAAEADELAEATGIRGWALGPLPAALWLERHEPDVADRTRWYLTTWEWLAFRLTGEAVAPLVPGQAVPDPAVVAEATDLHMDRRPPAAAMGAVVGALTATAADAARAPCRYPGRRRHERRVRELPRRRAPGAGRRLRPRRFGRWVRRLLARAGRGPGRVRDAGAARRVVQRRRGDGRHRPGARLVPRRGRRWRDHDRAAARGGRGDATRRRRPAVPAVSRRRALADLGSRRRRASSPD